LSVLRHTRRVVCDDGRLLRWIHLHSRDLSIE
jgi:hypothetical protein